MMLFDDDIRPFAQQLLQLLCCILLGESRLQNSGVLKKVLIFLCQALDTHKVGLQNIQSHLWKAHFPFCLHQNPHICPIDAYMEHNQSQNVLNKGSFFSASILYFCKLATLSTLARAFAICGPSFCHFGPSFLCNPDPFCHFSSCYFCNHSRPFLSL